MKNNNYQTLEIAQYVLIKRKKICNVNETT